jgi:branched-chain amino acid transport system permease protein
MSEARPEADAARRPPREAIGSRGAARSTRAREFHFRPVDLGRLATWSGYALVLFASPFVFTSSFSQTLLSQMGIAIIACLSYNILLGQGGMLSFGHAVYSGLGAFCAIHVLNLAAAGTLHWPVSLVPLAGGLAGLFFSALLGFVTTRKSGTTFAMITLGIGELVWSMSLMLPEFFGGEGGITGDRVVGPAVAGITFGPQRQVCELIAAYCFASTAAMFAFTRTPLGRLLNAVRDNPERVQFIGYDTQRVRWIAFMIAGFFAGIAGGLASINFEIVTAEVVGPARSGAYLLFTFLGGTSAFFGPVIGGVLMVLATVVLSQLTKAWPLYLGLAFLVAVMAAPGGAAGIVLANLRLARHGRLRPLLGLYAAVAAAGLAALAGFSTMIEMLYHLQIDQALGPRMRLAGIELDAGATPAWMAAAALTLAGAAAFEFVRRRLRARWDDAQADIERESRRREAQ